MEHILQECRMSSVLDSIGVKSQSAKELFNEQSKKWTSNLSVLNGRSEAWRTLKQMKSPDWTIHLPKLLENELVIRSLDPATASESQTEGWSQILFTGELSCINFVPFVLMYVALSKVFIAPLIAWSMPLMSFILPFLALKFIYRLPITWEMYWAQMRPMIFGRADQPFSVGTLLQWGSMLFSYAHGMYLPYTNAVHCYKIDQDMVKGAKAVVDTITRLRDISYIWVRFGLRKPFSFPDPYELGDDRQVLAWLVQDKTLLPQIYRAIGQVEICAAICSCDALVPVEWTQSSIPMCKMSDAVDPLLSEDKRVPFNLIMGFTC